jgi:hypothetical protein
MKILLSWSSGKDSAWALHLLNQQYPGAVAALLTTVNEAMDRVAMHGVRRTVLEAQARAAGLPLHVVHIPHPCPNDVYEAQMRAAAAAACAGFTHAAFGDLFSGIRRHARNLAGRPAAVSSGYPTVSCGMMIDGAFGRGLRVSTRGSSTRALPAGISIARCCAIFPDRSIRAASAVSSTRVSTLGRCSRSRSHSKSARRTRSHPMSGAI